MPLVSPFEQMAEERGIQNTLHDNIISILEKRFEVVPTSLTEKINNLTDIEQLQKLHLETISVNSVEEFENLLNN